MTFSVDIFGDSRCGSGNLEVSHAHLRVLNGDILGKHSLMDREGGRQRVQRMITGRFCDTH